MTDADKHRLLGEALDKLSVARIIVRRQSPYLYAAVLAMVPVPMWGLNTLGVTAKAHLLFDPEAVVAWDVNVVAGVLVHEVWHLLDHHHDRALGRDPNRWNRAADRALNPMVIEAGYKLPDGICLPEQIGQPNGLPAETYCLHEPEPEKDSGGDAGNEPKDGEGQPGEGQSGARRFHAADGHCGSGAGNPLPGEPQDGDGTPPGRSAADMSRVRRMTAQAIHEAATSGRSCGTLPGGWRVWSEVALRPPKIPWQTELARSVRNAITSRPGCVEHCWNKISRRQSGVGHGVGSPRLPAQHWPKPRIAVAIDTSGTMGSAEFKQIIPEVDGVLRSVGAEVDLVACDATVQNLKPIRKVQDVPALLRGGGGTDFRPIFDALRTRRPRPEVVIVMTDGCGPAPEQAPSWAHVVWVLVGKYKQAPCEWGRQILVEMDEPSRE